MKHLKQKKGFTLVEVIVVLVIVGILLAITIPSIMGYVKKAEGAKYQTVARTVNVKVTEYYEKKMINRGTKTTATVISEIKKELTRGGTNNIAGIIGVEGVGDYKIFSVDISFDNIYDNYGWAFDEANSKPIISKISVWFSKRDTTDSSHDIFPHADDKYVVTISNEAMLYYSEATYEMFGGPYNKEWPIFGPL